MSIVLGTAQFGSDYGIANKSGKVSDAEIKQILNIAQKNNIRMLDTAMDYGDCELRLGRNCLNQFKVITKISELNLDSNNIQRDIKYKFQKSLENLKIKKIYGLLLHRPEQLLSSRGDEIISALMFLKTNNFVEKIGISIYSPKILEKLLKKIRFDIVQVPFNILDNRIEKSGWLDKLSNLNIEIHARSIFLQGLLLMRYDELPKIYFKNHKDLILWYEWQKNNSSVDPYEICLKFVLSNSKIDKVLIGIDNRAQIIELVEKIKRDHQIIFPQINCNDENLINPSFWEYL